MPVAEFFAEYPSYSTVNLEDADDDDNDKRSTSVESVTTLGALNLPAIVFGAATLSHHYNGEDALGSATPFRTIRLALRYGVRAFDTSPYYGSSESILGRILAALSNEFPRSSYQLMTKCGRYGLHKFQFDYSPDTVRKSILRSLHRLNTSYLDIAYLHDVEFVATPRGPLHRTDDFRPAIGDEADAWGLAAGHEGVVQGPGDNVVLAAIAELFRLKDEGKVKSVGITGYSIPLLLRISILVKNTPPFRPLDVVMSYCHLTLQNDSLIDFLSHFESRAGVSQIVSASPLCMGLLTPSPPSWHPASTALLEASQSALQMCANHGGLPRIALNFAFRRGNEKGISTVVGLSTPNEVHRALDAFTSSTRGEEHLLHLEKDVQRLYSVAGLHGWSWVSPPVLEQ